MGFVGDRNVINDALYNVCVARSKAPSTQMLPLIYSSLLNILMPPALRKELQW